ncbi:MAG: MerR family transcriptional regulator, partial [Woeseiaceae bacterium]
MAKTSTAGPNKTIAIGAVSRLLGVSTHALRKWETRYGAISPTRSEGGDRRYSADDVERLARLATLVGQGHAIGTIASLSDEALDDILGSKRVVDSQTAEALRCVVVGSRLWAELE